MLDIETCTVTRQRLPEYEVSGPDDWQADQERLEASLRSIFARHSDIEPGGIRFSRLIEHNSTGTIMLRVSQADAEAECSAPPDSVSGPQADENASTTFRFVILVSCPRWYYGKCPELTCLLPPEAARTLKRGSRPHGMSPDAVLHAGNVSRVRKACTWLVRRVQTDAFRRRFIRYVGKMLEAVSQIDGRTQVPLGRLRGAIKRVMHIHGLGLRHARVVLD